MKLHVNVFAIIIKIKRRKKFTYTRKKKKYCEVENMIWERKKATSV
jgi:hypothetical protein